MKNTVIDSRQKDLVADDRYREGTFEFQITCIYYQFKWMDFKNKSINKLKVLRILSTSADL